MFCCELQAEKTFVYLQDFKETKKSRKNAKIYAIGYVIWSPADHSGRLLKLPSRPTMAVRAGSSRSGFAKFTTDFQTEIKFTYLENFNKTKLCSKAPKLALFCGLFGQLITFTIGLLFA